MSDGPKSLVPFRLSLAGTLLATREAFMVHIRPILRDAGLTEQQWRVLRVLVDEGTLDPSGLARQALLHAASVTRIVQELNERGLVTRAADPDDGRRSLVSVTPAGQSRVEQTAKHTLVILRAYYRAFGEKRLSKLIQELRELQVAINESGVVGDDPAGGRDLRRLTRARVARGRQTKTGFARPNTGNIG